MKVLGCLPENDIKCYEQPTLLHSNQLMSQQTNTGACYIKYQPIRCQYCGRSVFRDFPSIQMFQTKVHRADEEEGTVRHSDVVSADVELFQNLEFQQKRGNICIKGPYNCL